MRRDAFLYADGGRENPPLELETAWRCEDIGAETVLGVNASAKIVRRVALSKAVYRAYISRRDYRDEDGAKNWTEWAGLNPEASVLLNLAAKEANGESE